MNEEQEKTNTEENEIKIGDKVTLSLSSEKGEVIGLATHKSSDPQANVRYMAADGRLVENWWNLDVLNKLDEKGESKS